MQVCHGVISFSHWTAAHWSPWAVAVLPSMLSFPFRLQGQSPEFASQSGAPHSETMFFGKIKKKTMTSLQPAMPPSPHLPKTRAFCKAHVHGSAYSPLVPLPPSL